MIKINKSELIERLNEKWQTKCCPMCGCNNWNISDKIFELREYQDGNLVVGGNTSITPVIPVICDNCGNTIFINPIVAEVVKK